MSRRLPILLAACTLSLGAQAQSAVAAETSDGALTMPQPFTTTYDLEWRGMGAGTSTLELARIGGNEYSYRSTNVARALFRFAFPNPITQASRFVFEGGVIKPTSYHADDGTSKRDKDIDLEFDWRRMRATGTSEQKPVDVPLQPGTQDALSGQVSLMMELSAGRSPQGFLLFDKTEVKEYRYVREGTATLDTPLGKLETVIYHSERTGSSRITRLWLAPSLGYLPVRGEQLRNGRREFGLAIRSVKRH